MPVSPHSVSSATPITPDLLQKELDKQIPDNPQKVMRELQSQIDASKGETAAAVKAPEYKPELEVSAADKEAYIRSLLAKERFKKTYPMFRDVYKVTFQTRTVVENRAAKEFANKVIGEDEHYKALERAELCYSLVEVKHKQGESLKNDRFVIDDTPTLEILETQQAGLYYAILSAFREFEDIADEMWRRATRPDFWKPTAGPS